MVDTRRRALALARRRSKDSMKAWHDHAAGCWECHHAEHTGETIRYCDSGWLLAKEVSRSAVEVDRLESVEKQNWYGEQEALF